MRQTNINVLYNAFVRGFRVKYTIFGGFTTTGCGLYTGAGYSPVITVKEKE